MFNELVTVNFWNSIQQWQGSLPFLVSYNRSLGSLTPHPSAGLNVASLQGSKFLNSKSSLFSFGSARILCPQPGFPGGRV